MNQSSFIDTYHDQPPVGDDLQGRLRQTVIDILQSVIVAVALSVFLYLFVITPNEVDGVSMSPNFETGDLLFTSKLHKWFNNQPWSESLGLQYKRGDVVVFQKPGFSDFVKRIVALPGEEISIRDGVYYINGAPLREFYDIKNLDKDDGTRLRDGGDPMILADDEYFLTGDNRDDSFDSRSLGAIKEEWIKGRVIFRFWPMEKLGVIGSGKSEI